MLKIAVDAMGGDYAPSEVIRGAKLAVDEWPIEIVLVGPEDEVNRQLKLQHLDQHPQFKVVHASEVVGMGESPSVSFRTKKNSSIRVGLELVKSKDVSAFVSAGNTGAVMTASTLILGRVKNVERPAIASVIPTKLSPVVVLDLGANVDCKPEHLAQFAVMGSLLAQFQFNLKKPKVGLLNIGEEDDKGNVLTQETFALLEELHEKGIIRFIGNVEGKEIVTSTADVVVCDGFVGNSLLKFGEGLMGLVNEFFKTEAKSSIRSLLGLFLLKPMLKRFKAKFDHQEYGGAPLLGVNGVSIIAHGSSKAIAIKNAIRMAKIEAEAQIVTKIAQALNQ